MNMYSLVQRLTLATLLLCTLGCRPTTTQQEQEGHNHSAHSEEQISVITADQIKSVGIEIGTIDYKELSATIRANGSIHVPNSHKAYASALYGGLVHSLSVHPGDRVRKGQVIATIANPQFVQLQEEYLTTESRVIYARAERKRQEMLEAEHAGAMKDLQAAISELASLEARHSSLVQQLRLMGIAPEQVSTTNIRPYLNITSPISGVISQVMGKIGGYVDVSTPLAEIIDNSGMHLEMNIYEQDLPKVRPGQIIHFRLTNNPHEEYDAQVYSISTTFEPDSRTIAVHCELRNDISHFIDGMNITGVVSLGQVTSPALPDEAVIHRDGKDYIYIEVSQPDDEHQHENNDDKTKKHYFKPIEVIRGASQLGYTAITALEELPKQAQIVRRGAFFVHAKLSNSGEHAHEH